MSGKFIDKVGTKKGVITLAIIIVCIIIIILLIKFLPRILKRSNEQKETQAYNKSINPANVTLSPAQFVSMSNALDAAFNYIFGTDEDAIYRVFSQLQTDDDLYSLMQAFGRKRSDVYTRILAPIGATWEEADLTRWINDELEEEELARLNQILANKPKITFRF